MLCPVCASDKGRILETRTAAGGKVDRRRHECACGVRWTSRAVVEPGSVLSVTGGKTDATGSVMHERRDATRSVSLVSPLIGDDTRHTLPAACPPRTPPPTGSVDPLPVACGGVGGGLPSGQIPFPISHSDPDPGSTGNPIRARGRTATPAKETYPVAFELQWQATAKTGSKFKAFEAWKRHGQPELGPKWAEWARLDSWVRGFVPHVVTWINGRCYEQDPVEPVAAAPGAPASRARSAGNVDVLNGWLNGKERMA